MGRSPCCSKVGLRRGPWSTKEDTLLADYIQKHGEGQWRSLPKNAGLLRCGKSCRLRWMNYLRPGIKRGNISEDEEDLIVRLHKLLGNRWSLIAGRLPGRTDNEIKNYWNTHLLKKIKITGGGERGGGFNKIKKKKKKKKKEEEEDLAVIHTDEQPITEAAAATKVYLPKPIRLSSSAAAFSRTNSYDSLSSSDASCGPPPLFLPWPPLFEHDDDGDFLNAAALIHHSDSISGDVNMWEKVYDEYMQLL
ncbi:hypothetical protein ACS0TY_012861 [Phlomoides rotata]